MPTAVMLFSNLFAIDFDILQGLETVVSLDPPIFIRNESCL
jgi:hypothetical protein